MVYISDTEQQAQLRRLQLQFQQGRGRGLEEIERQIEVLNREVLRDPNIPETERQGILNMLRNTDHKHSVDTWWNTVPVAGSQQTECANVYTYPKFQPITITDAEMTSGANTLDSPSGPFTSAMTGRYAVVTGAGAAGANLSGVMTYVNANRVTLSVNASTTVTGASARINLLKLTHKNAKTHPADTVNDSLKDASHTNYASNLSDPDWKKASGIVRYGTDGAVVGYPFGRFASNGTTYVPLHLLEAGREPYFRVNLARANRYVKIRGQMFVGIYNNNDLYLDYVKGSSLSLTASVQGNPSTTVSTEYKLVLETDQGYTLVSQTVTVANAPDDAAFAAGARVTLRYPFFAGATVAKIYRKRSGGNVFLLEPDANPRGHYVDTNYSGRIDTGSASFPVIADSQSAIRAYWASPDGELDGVAVDGVSENWTVLEGRIPFPSSIIMANVFDPHLIIGLTEPLSVEVTDAVSNGSVKIDSAAAQFTADMVGNEYILTNPVTGTVWTGTIAGFGSASSVDLNSAPTESGTNFVFEIKNAAPRGLFYDLVGVSLHDGEWNAHVEDDSELRGQAVEGNPNGSTQGGTTGNRDTGGGIIIIRCVLDETMIEVFSPDGMIEKRADEITISDLLHDGHGGFNRVERIDSGYVSEIYRIQTASASLGCTDSHRICRSEKDFRAGFPVKNLAVGENLLIKAENGCKMETVLGVSREKGQFRVISFGLKKTKSKYCSLFVAGKVNSHNSKEHTPIE